MDLQELKKIDFVTLSQEVLQQNPILISKIQTATQIPSEDIPNLFTEMLRFLFLIKLSNQILTPSLLVDLAWHELILCTRYYADFCDKHFQKFIHHHPGGLEEENHKQFLQTLKLYNLAFGEIPIKFWGPIASKINHESECGSCSN